MADENGNLQVLPGWPGIYELKETDAGLGGIPERSGANAVRGDLNIPLAELASRSLWLRERMDGIDLGAGDDLDAITDLGMYRWQISGPLNAPTGLTSHAVMRVATDGTQPIQTVWGGTGSRMAMRRRDSGGWTAWSRFWSDTEDPVFAGPSVAITLPNGLEFKMGAVVEGAFPRSLIFDTAFENSVQFIGIIGWTVPLGHRDGTVTGTTVIQTAGSPGNSGFNWLAIGN